MHFAGSFANFYRVSTGHSEVHDFVAQDVRVCEIVDSELAEKKVRINLDAYHQYA